LAGINNQKNDNDYNNDEMVMLNMFVDDMKIIIMITLNDSDHYA